MAVNNIVYAPVLAASLPACTRYGLTIPFTHNPAVAKSEVKKFHIIFKDINTSAIKQEFDAGAANGKAEQFIDAGKITYTDNSVLNKLAINTSYKVQIAYVGEGQTKETLRYSTAGIIRMVAYPKYFLISENKQTTFGGASNNANKLTGKTSARTFTGLYDTNTTSEVVYEYRFVLKSGATALEDTGWQLHDSSADKLRTTSDDGSYRKSCFDYFSPQTDLSSTETSYNLIYYVRTVNGLEISTNASFSMQGFSMVEPYQIAIGQTPRGRENGYVDIQLKYYNGDNQITTDKTFYQQPAEKRTGTFVLRRTDSISNFSKWDNMIRFTLTTNTGLDNLHWVDGTIESGVTYKYALSRLETVNGVTAVKSWQESDKFTPYFEHLFLADENCQLCMRFNPQVSSVKYVVQETKQDTIGGKYPIFFKNGDLNYMEIPISGLVSYLMDEDNLFCSKSSIGINDDNPATINLTEYNVAAERNFKLKVLNWLNNGKPKYLRSATEGNYIVRTLNNSMSPNTQVGRMLHTVTSTGDEVAENTVSNLIKHKVLYVKKVVGRVSV